MAGLGESRSARARWERSVFPEKLMSRHDQIPGFGAGSELETIVVSTG
jgi:hypothetical protein